MNNRAYWASTALLAVECVVGGIWGGLRLPPFDTVIVRLGYPVYLMTLLGVWYALAGVVLLVPRLPRLKEWAYAGLMFNYSGAFASHLAVGDGVGALLGPIFFIAVTATSWWLRPSDRRDLARRTPADVPGVLRTSLFWLVTFVVAAEMVAGAIWDLLQIDYVRAVLTHLGYPHYLLLILGVWKLPCALVVLLPRFVRLKEWAYAGAVFNYSGALVSHVVIGDGATAWGGPLALTVFTLASWALRPPARRYEGLAADSDAARYPAARTDVGSRRSPEQE